VTRTCEGPGHDGKACDKTVRSGVLCPGHTWQKKTHGVLKPLLGPGGQKYVNAVKLEIRNLPKEHAFTLFKEGAKMPPRDARDTSFEGRTARWLVTAFTDGGAKLLKSHRPEKTLPLLARVPSAEAEALCIMADAKEREALEALGALIPPAHKRDNLLAARGLRHLLRAYHEGGLRILASHAKKS
jgi:hypothetical protein